MGLKKYFFDSYALIELTKGNPNYFKYRDQIVTITIFNLIEVVYSIFLDHGKEKARESYKKLHCCVQDVDQEIIIKALEIKLKYKKRHLSYADCIGYAFAKMKGMIFLTGDKEFWDLDKVEFVK